MIPKWKRPSLPGIDQRLQKSLHPPNRVEHILPYGKLETWHPVGHPAYSLKKDSISSTQPEASEQANSDDQLTSQLAGISIKKRHVLNKIPFNLADDETVLVDGVRITKIGGGDYDVSLENITLFSRKDVVKSKHPRDVLKRSAMYFVRLENIVSPSNFCMEFILDPPNDFQSWDDCLQAFYEDPENAKYKMCTFSPREGHMYAVFNEGEGKWERIRVLQFAPLEGTVSGICLDRLVSFDSIPVDSLYELHPKFGYWPRHPLRGGLCDILPASAADAPETEDEPDDWSPEAVEYFQNFVKGKLFRAFVLTKALDVEDNLFHQTKEDVFTKTSVFLFEVGAESQIPVNAWLVLKGYAVPTKSMGNYQDVMESFHGASNTEQDLETEAPLNIDHHNSKKDDRC